jgi:type I restriction enzyme S subunit
MSWKEVTLLEVTSLIGDGLHGTPIYDDNGEYYFINGNNLEDGRIILKNETKRISKQEYLKIKKNLTDRTIFIGINGTLGNLAFYNNEKVALGKSACYLNINNDINKLFIYYSLKSLYFQNYAELFATGATIKNLSLKAIRNYKFNLPQLKIQNKIANLLSNYDNLIQNNIKRIKLLEEMAEEIYKEWFVRLHFPDYENSTIIDGIPVGWKEKRFFDFGKIVIGKTPLTDKAEYYNGDIPFIKTPDFKQGIFLISSDEKLTTVGAQTQKNQYIEENSICVSCIGTVGEVIISTKKSQTNQQINTINLDNLNYLEYVYFSIKRLKPLILAYASTGATMGNLSKGKFEQIKLIMPSNNVMSKFHKICSPIFEEIKILQKKNQTLKQIRDLLLPRLISGKLDLKNIEII